MSVVESVGEAHLQQTVGSLYGNWRDGWIICELLKQVICFDTFYCTLFCVCPIKNLNLYNIYLNEFNISFLLLLTFI